MNTRSVAAIGTALILLFVGCSGFSPTTTSTPTPPPTTTSSLTATPTSPPSTTTTMTETPTRQDVCPSISETAGLETVAPELWFTDGAGGWERVKRSNPGYGLPYIATYRSPDGVLFGVEIQKFDSRAGARAQAREYRNYSDYQVTMVYEEFVWAVNAFTTTTQNGTLRVTTLAERSVEPAKRLLASVQTGVVGGPLGMACVNRLASLHPPAKPITHSVEIQDPPTPTQSNGEWTVTVVEIVDGDTMEIRYRNGTRDTIRLLGVDTPETYGSVNPDEWEEIPDTEAGRRWLRMWGAKAKLVARQRLLGEQVRIKIDESADRRGAYGRLLVYVFDDGELFNRHLLTGGYARVYESDFSREQAFIAESEQAQSNNVGVWAFKES